MFKYIYIFVKPRSMILNELTSFESFQDIKFLPDVVFHDI